MEPSTSTPQRSGLESQATVSSFLTSVVLLVGVFGGLFIVVTVIIICKYCHGKGKPVKRQGFRSPSIENYSDRTYCALHRYETINSDVFSDPSSCSIDCGGPLTPRKPVDFRVPELNQESEEPNETTKLKNDYEQPDYSHQDITKPPTSNAEQYAVDAAVSYKEQEDPPSNVSGSSSVGTGYGSRRVSFQLSNLPRSSSSGDFKFRRYIEGDYHHLKHSKIGRSFPRQFSIGGAGSAVPGRILLDDPQFRFSSLDERLTNSSQQNHGQFTVISQLSQNDPILRSLRDLQMHSSATQLYVGGNQQQQPQQQQQQLQQQHPSFQPQLQYQRRHTFSKDISPRHSRDTLIIDNSNTAMVQRNSSDKLNSPSPTYNHSGANKSPRMLKNSPSPTFNYVWDGTKLSPSPPNSRTIRESRSTSPLALSARDSIVGGGGTVDSPPSPFMPIKEFNNNNGSTPSPPHKPTKTQVAVEVHQQLQHNVMETSGNSSTNSDEMHQQLQIRLDRTRFHTGHVSPSRNGPMSRHKGLYGTVYSNSLESANQTQRSSYSDSRKVKSYDDYKEDYDVLKITEFSKGPFHSADYEVMAELGSPTGSKVRYNDTGSLEQLHDEDVVSLCGVADYNNQHPHVNNHHHRHHPQQDAGAELKEIIINESEAGAEGSDGNNSGNGSVTGNRKYRALWRLRATLEEEEECSDTIRMEDMTSPDDSPDREHATTPNTTSFESNALSDPCPSDHRDSGVQFEPTTKTHNHRANLLHPNYENRRQNYRNVMNNMLQRRAQSTSVENSFDSVETDGDVSDTSRYEVTTTSFESTTDNTDSTTESQASRLKQMKADSGYKSLESQQQSSKEVLESKNGNGSSSSSSNGSSNGHTNIHSSLDVRKEILRVSLDRKEEFGRSNTIGLCTSTMETTIVPLGSPSPSRERQNGPGNGNSAVGPSTSSKHGCVRKSPPNTSRFDRRNGKTASKKRREYSRERQIPLVDESIMYEPETDSRSDLHSGDSFEENNPIPNKTSLFTRFFKSHSRGHKTQYLVRDYSIDEKTNSIFNEFVRQDNPASSSSSRDHAGRGRLGVRRSPRMHRHRFQRKHTEPSFFNEERMAMRNRLAPGMRSASLGSDSSASSARRISPQDSIEEEEDELEEAAANHESRFSYSLDRHPSFGLHGQSYIPGQRSPSNIKGQLKCLGIHDIPIIKLPEEDCHDTH